MGTHVMGLNKDLNQPCNDLPPYQLRYNKGRLNGFVFVVFGNTTDPRQEALTEFYY